MPPATSASSVSWLSLAGPIVQTIFVRRSPARPFSLGAPVLTFAR
jgi:hypothetical protein